MAALFSVGLSTPKASVSAEIVSTRASKCTVRKAFYGADVERAPVQKIDEPKSDCVFIVSKDDSVDDDLLPAFRRSSGRPTPGGRTSYSYNHPDQYQGQWREGPGITRLSRSDNPSTLRNYNEEEFYRAEFENWEEPEDPSWWRDARQRRPLRGIESGPISASSLDNIMEGLEERNSVKYGRSRVDLTDVDNEEYAPLRSNWNVDDSFDRGSYRGREPAHETRTSNIDNIMDGFREREMVKRGHSKIEDITDLNNEEYDIHGEEHFPAGYPDPRFTGYDVPRWAQRASSVDNIHEAFAEREATKRNNTKY